MLQISNLSIMWPVGPQCFQLNHIENKDCPMASKKISCGKELKSNYKPNLNVNEKFQESLEKDLLIELHGFLKKKLSIGTWKYYQIREQINYKGQWNIGKI